MNGSMERYKEMDAGGFALASGPFLADTYSALSGLKWYMDSRLVERPMRWMGG